MGLRIPAHLQDAAQSLGLRTWVGGKGFDKEAHHSAIKVYRARLASFTDDGDVPNELLVQMIATTLDAEGALL